MARYNDYYSGPIDYDMDDYDPFTTKREDRYWEHLERRRARGVVEEDFDGDWDD